MEIYQLRTFVTVAKLGHITKAAEALHVTQPAVTGHIKALEQDLGITLFDRGHGRISLTKAGELLLPEVEKTLSAFNLTLAKAKELKGEITGRVLIGTVGDPDFLRLGSFLNGLLNALPLLEIKTRSALAASVLDAVASGEIAAGYYIGTVNNPDVASLGLRGVRYRVVAPANYGERLPACGWGEIAGMPWIGAPEKSHVHQLLVSLFGRQGLRPNIVMETDELTSPHSLVRAGLGLSLMREDIALLAAEKGEISIWSHAAADTQLSFLYRVDTEFDPVLVGMLSILRDTWGASPVA
ncbi:MAG TPA: LysR family transcriptional regulator [Noviherbaspirillum sp.]|uniref:LysR family transcriptional regulator n=1 Tax=Noviherbaspirillum sp. TaxID=1926288 RepID=UPI002B467712|nr:LysR family transcriptional regulator [Noviherbaspirillum sp.]HJV84796.1 LysR family transcriptional regulator [Noviherbaspirillum sp.]